MTNEWKTSPNTLGRLDEVIEVAGTVDNTMDFYLVSSDNVEDEI
jgi:hypothetical protein